MDAMLPSWNLLQKFSAEDRKTTVKAPYLGFPAEKKIRIMQELINIIRNCTEYNRIKLINSSCNNNSKENITVILMHHRKHKFIASK